MSSREPIRVFEKYEVIRRLATGGMGDIFLARQIGVAGFNRVVVLKSLRPDVVERDEFFAQFLNEARTAATLNHPNVVAVYEIDEFRGVYFIAMEYIDGTDLGAVLRAAPVASASRFASARASSTTRRWGSTTRTPPKTGAANPARSSIAT
jgi:serine/threonine-protein kinase